MRRLALVALAVCLAVQAGCALLGPGDPHAGDAVFYCAADLYGGGLRLYAMHGSESTVLTPPSYEVMIPTLSPDGTRLAYERSQGADQYGIYTANLDGSGRRRLLTGAGTGYDIEPSWSPAGDQIVFVRRKRPARGLCVVDADGSDCRRVEGPPSGAAAPDWSPDGRRIVYASTTAMTGGHLAVVDAGGGVPQRITRGKELGPWTPAWSPDGEWIAFSGSNENGGRSLFIVHPDGTGLKQLTSSQHRTDDEPVWSADGERLYFWTNEWGWDALWGLAFMDVAAAERSEAGLSPGSGGWHKLRPTSGPQGKEAPGNGYGLAVGSADE